MTSAPLTAQARAALEAIGTRDATPDRIRELGVTRGVLHELVGRGYLTTYPIVLAESQSGSLAAQAPAAVLVHRLTPAGAEVIGADTWRIGAA